MLESPHAKAIKGAGVEHEEQRAESEEHEIFHRAIKYHGSNLSFITRFYLGMNV